MRVVNRLMQQVRLCDPCKGGVRMVLEIVITEARIQVEQHYRSQRVSEVRLRDEFKADLVDLLRARIVLRYSFRLIGQNERRMSRQVMPWIRDRLVHCR